MTRTRRGSLGKKKFSRHKTQAAGLVAVASVRDAVNFLVALSEAAQSIRILRLRNVAICWV